ncbi:unnamed protein product [Amoebophrya sp. A25]|nr:unnamed protein product [Amoebophrya sp. A25]|eukprot:GSA25T00011436001.1
MLSSCQKTCQTTAVTQTTAQEVRRFCREYADKAAPGVIFNQRGSTTSQEQSTGEIISSTTAKRPSTPNSAPFSRHLVYRKFQGEIIDVREQLIKQKYLQWIEDIAREECKLFAATLQQAMKRYERQRTFDEAALAGVVTTTGAGGGATKSGTSSTVAGGRATRNGTSSTSGATTSSSSKTLVLIEQGATALSGLLSMRRPSNVSPMTTIERVRQQNMGNKTAKNGNGASTSSSKIEGKLKNGSGSSAAAPTAAEIKQEMREKERLHKRQMTTLLLDSWWSLLELFSYASLQK